MNIVITGASNGIGYQTAMLLAGQGHQVFAVARNKENLERLTEAVQKINGQTIKPIVADISREEEVLKISKTISTHTDTLNVLINNAGTLVNKPFEELKLEDWHTIYHTNVFASVNLIKHLLPLFKSNKDAGVKGHILNISSMGGFQGSAKFKGLSAYSSSKAALVNVTECLAEEFIDYNIAVNCLCLGSVQTEMFTTAFPQFKAATNASEMASFIARFALDGQKLFNGKVLPVSNSTP